MSVLDKIGSSFKIYTSDMKSSTNEIDELLKYSNIDVPIEFLDIIREKTEIEICVNNEKFIRIWGAKSCIDMNDAYNIQKYIPNSLAIGDDECSNAILYTYGQRGFGLYMVAFNDLDIDELIYISYSLESFLVNEEGVDVFNSIW